jgi:pimeloyl-ACP methyl ester carboxylesterase
LVITGTHDNNVPSSNSLVIAGKIPGAWLVQIKGAGHALFVQYPNKVNSIADISFDYDDNNPLVDEYTPSMTYYDI